MERDYFLNWTCSKHGNLIKNVYSKKQNDPKQDVTIAQYVYDATNRMVKGTNEKNEQSVYVFNGLGHLVANEWYTAKNAYGYHGTGEKAYIRKDFVLDYTRTILTTLMETESGDGGLTYRYTHGLRKENVVIYGIDGGAGSVTQQYGYPTGSADVVKLFYHHNRLGNTDYISDNITGKVTSYVTYDD